jgi:hypothetical protein
MQIALAIIDKMIAAAEAVDSKTHEALAWLKAVRERLTMTFSAKDGGAGEECPCFASMKPHEQEDVDTFASELRSIAQGS